MPWINLRGWVNGPEFGRRQTGCGREVVEAAVGKAVLDARGWRRRLRRAIRRQSAHAAGAAAAEQKADDPVGGEAGVADPGWQRRRVGAYVVDGLRKERIKPILDAAVARFHLFSRMRAELAASKAALAEPSAIDRAKGLLMRAKASRRLRLTRCSARPRWTTGARSATSPTSC